MFSVTEYLDGTTQNPLVITPNITLASDLRVFQSDGNQTMKRSAAFALVSTLSLRRFSTSLADPNQFNSQCQALLERMLNTIPRDVTLTDEITLLPAKAWGVQLTIENNQLLFKSNLRVRTNYPYTLCNYSDLSPQLTQPINDKLNQNRTVTMFWCDKYGGSANCKSNTKSAQPAKVVQDDPNNSPITLRMGFSFVHYKFVVPITAAQSISKFWFEVDEHNGTTATVYNNEGDSYVVPQDQVVFVPTLSTAAFRSNNSYVKNYTNRNGEVFTKTLNFTAAVRWHDLSAVYPQLTLSRFGKVAIRHGFMPLSLTLPSITSRPL